MKVFVFISLCSPGWLQNYFDPISVSYVLELDTCTTTLSPSYINLRLALNSVPSIYYICQDYLPIFYFLSLCTNSFLLWWKSFDFKLSQENFIAIGTDYKWSLKCYLPECSWVLGISSAGGCVVRKLQPGMVRKGDADANDGVWNRNNQNLILNTICTLVSLMVKTTCSTRISTKKNKTLTLLKPYEPYEK